MHGGLEGNMGMTIWFPVLEKPSPAVGSDSAVKVGWCVGRGESGICKLGPSENPGQGPHTALFCGPGHIILTSASDASR